MSQEKELLNKLHSEIRSCSLCELHSTRTNAVPGEGPFNARIMIIGEGPGEQNDLFGRPFIGKGGQILDSCLKQAGLLRKEIFLTNIIKCRMPHNATPSNRVISCCSNHLERQIDTIKPVVLIALGLPASKYLLKTKKLKLVDVNNEIMNYKSCKLICTYHPSSIRYNINAKEKIVSALITAKQILGENTI